MTQHIDFADFNWGGVQFPLTAQAKGAPLLELCDPSLSVLLQFIKTCINTYAGPALVSAAKGTPADQPILHAVAQVVPIDPPRVGTHTPFRFPLLAGWRTTAKYSNRTTTWRQREAKFRMMYVLPPLDADALVNIDPILTAIESIVDDRLWQGFDPNFNHGERVFMTHGLSRAWLADTERVWSQFSKDIDFSTLILDIEGEERQDVSRPPVSKAPHLQSDLDVQNAADPDNPVDPQVQVRSGSTTP